MNGEQFRTGLAGSLLRPTSKAMPGHARAHNRALILSSLFHAGPLSRAELARVTGLTKVTVSDLVTELTGQGLIRELGAQAQNGPGKPGNLIDIDAEGHAIAVLDLSDTATARGALITLRGHVRARSERATEGATGAAMADLARQVAASLIAKAGEAVLLGVGVASPGVLTPAGEVVYAKDYQWSSFALGSTLRASLGAPVYAANDANLRALAEFTFAGASAQGLMEVSLTDGLGAGILLDGALLRGPSNAAGEIGHIPAMAGGDPCTCGRRGCLETVLNRRVLAQATETTPDAVPGPPAAATAAILDRVGASTAAVLAPIVSAFNLSDLVFADPRGLVTPAVLQAIEAALEERVLPQIMADLDVRVSELGADAALLGAGALVLAERLGLT
ncbi:MAG: ROK family transcriptional regulator [Bifidobacteriaceae bacterium]|jgi:predicted NBD/HSP70 family sugar kinase|nr:ROK family transcriptional regulator [Bifidobacteriaceae bacterium]